MTERSPLDAPVPRGKHGHPRQLYCAVWIAAALILRIAMPYIPVPAHPLIDLAGGIVYMLVLLAMAIELGARLGPHTRLAVYALLASAVIFAAAMAASEMYASRIAQDLMAGRIEGAIQGRLPAPLWMLVSIKDLSMIVFAVLGGALLSLIAREPKLLLPIAVTAAVVDIVGVMYEGGPTARVLQENPELVQTLAATIPDIGAATPAETGGVEGVHPGLALGFIGIGDWLFIGIFFAALTRFDLSFRASKIGAIIASVTAMVLVLLGGLPIPGLPFIAAGCVIPNLHRFRYTRQEKVALAVGGLFVVAICTALILLGRSALDQPPGRP